MDRIKMRRKASSFFKKKPLTIVRLQVEDNNVQQAQAQLSTIRQNLSLLLPECMRK